MPPKNKTAKQDILDAAVQLVRECGTEALSARVLAARLSTSTQPIFSNYSSMDKLMQEVVEEADRIFSDYIECEVAKGEYPPYKASGMAYIRFAREERELFKLLFMCNREGEFDSDSTKTTDGVIKMLRDKTGLDTDRAKRFHASMWIFLHGIAALSVTGFLDIGYELISEMMTDVFVGLDLKYKKDSENAGND